MFLEKVKDLSKLELGKQQVLVEQIVKKHKGKLELVGEKDITSTDELVKVVVIASNYEGIEVGDILIDYRMMLGANGMLKLEDRVFAVVMGHDIKLWTKPENYDEDRKIEKKESLITEAKQGFSAADLRKIESEAKGLESKYLNNK